MHPSLLAPYDALERRKHNLLSQLSALGSAQLAFRPAPDAWSLVDMADHLVLIEHAVAVGLEKGLPDGKRRPKLGQRLARPFLGLALRLPLRFKIPTERVAPRPGRSLDEVAEEWSSVRRRIADRLQALGQTDMARPALLHPVAGPMSAQEALVFLAAHFDHHLKQVDRIRSSPGFPAAGAAA